MFCRNCGNKINDQAAFCTHCGVLKDDGDKYCPNCGAMPDPRAVVCVKCGVRLKPVIDGGGGSSKVTTNVYGFVEAIKRCFMKYADFSGRACRAEYWYWILFVVITSTIMLIGISIFAENFNDSYVVDRTRYGVEDWKQISTYHNNKSHLYDIGFICYGIYAFLLLLPSLAVLTRRLHDIGRSGWLFLLMCIPFIGQLMLLLWCCEDSHAETNRYGTNPKHV